jgi:hypothetical protein
MFYLFLGVLGDLCDKVFNVLVGILEKDLER